MPHHRWALWLLISLPHFCRAPCHWLSDWLLPLLRNFLLIYLPLPHHCHLCCSSAWPQARWESSALPWDGDPPLLNGSLSVGPLCNFLSPPWPSEFNSLMTKSSWPPWELISSGNAQPWTSFPLHLLNFSSCLLRNRMLFLFLVYISSFFLLHGCLPSVFLKPA